MRQDDYADQNAPRGRKAENNPLAAVGAAFDMFADAVSFCPDQLWTATLWDDPEDKRFGQVWSVASHALRWTDIYLQGVPKPDDAQIAPPFLNGGLPENPYTKAEVQAHLQACRRKAQAAMESLTEERAHQPATWGQPYLDMQLMSMRHLQEHASQLGLLLGQHDVSGPDWIPRVRD